MVQAFRGDTFIATATQAGLAFADGWQSMSFPSELKPLRESVFSLIPLSGSLSPGHCGNVTPGELKWNCHTVLSSRIKHSPLSQNGNLPCTVWQYGEHLPWDSSLAVTCCGEGLPLELNPMLSLQVSKHWPVHCCLFFLAPFPGP